MQLKELNHIAYLIGLLEGRDRSRFFSKENRVMMDNSRLFQKLVARWEATAQNYLAQFKSQEESYRQLKKVLLVERVTHRTRGLMAYSERVIKSS